MTEHSAERRRAPRAPANFAVRVADQGRSQDATVKDLSTIGLACHVGEAIAEMTVLELGLELPGQTELHTVQGAVVRCAKVRGINPPTYEVAVYFTQTPPATRQAIERYVSERLART